MSRTAILIPVYEPTADLIEVITELLRLDIDDIFNAIIQVLTDIPWH